MKLDNLKHGMHSFLNSVSEGWQHLRHSAASALTAFKPHRDTNLPAKSEVDDVFYIPSGTWSMLGENVFEDDKRLVVQLEIPGLDKSDIDIRYQDEALIISGEKKFEKENTEGRYRVLQCAYGSFRRVVPLPSPVDVDRVQATYRNGVLRIELPKTKDAQRRTLEIH